MKTKQLMDDWKDVELRDVCKVITGYAFDSNLFNGDKKGMPLVRIRNISQGYTNTYYSGDYSQYYLIDNGDLLVGMDGEFNIFKWNGGKALLNQRVCKLIPNLKELSLDYLSFILIKKLKEIENRTPYVTVKHISSKQIQSIKLKIPSVVEQERIASILEKAEKIKELGYSAQNLLDEYLKGVFNEMFYNKGFEEVELRTIVNNKKDFVDGPFGSDLKVSDHTNRGVRLIQINNIGVLNWRDKITRYTSEDKYFKLIRHEVKNGDIVIAKMGEPLGRACFVPESINKAIIVADCMRLRVTNIDFDKHYILFFLNTEYSKKQIENLSHGSTRIRINLSMIKSLKVPYPPLNLQQKFARIFENIQELKDNIKKTNKNSEELYNSLIDKAFRGEL